MGMGGFEKLKWFLAHVSKSFYHKLHVPVNSKKKIRWVASFQKITLYYTNQSRIWKMIITRSDQWKFLNIICRMDFNVMSPFLQILTFEVSKN